MVKIQNSGTKDHDQAGAEASAWSDQGDHQEVQEHPLRHCGNLSSLTLLNCSVLIRPVFNYVKSFMRVYQTET